MVGVTRKHLPPGHDIGIAITADGGENVFSVSGGPYFGNDGECPEYIRLVAGLANMIEKPLSDLLLQDIVLTG